MSLVWSWGHRLGCWGPRPGCAVYFETALVHALHVQSTARRVPGSPRGLTGLHMPPMAETWDSISCHFFRVSASCCFRCSFFGRYSLWHSEVVAASESLYIFKTLAVSVCTV